MNCLNSLISVLESIKAEAEIEGVAKARPISKINSRIEVQKIDV